MSAAADALGVPVATIYKMVAQHRVASTRLLAGRTSRIYIRECDLLAYLESVRQPAVGTPQTSERYDPEFDVLKPPAHRRFS